MFNDIYKGKRVLVTGHTGFKGSWLSLWLDRLGAEVIGYGHPPSTIPNHHTLLGNVFPRGADLLNKEFLFSAVRNFKPDIIFHLAAKAIVARTFKEPQETFENNVMGAVNILEACRLYPSVKGIVMITTDKVYENKEWAWGYRENDDLGGLDPYSASKVCIEHVIECYRSKFFPMIATARAGNVIGGGDWAYKRLIPDIMRATAEGKPVEVHTPYATRPWQHVIEPLCGYLMLGQKLLEHGKDCEPFNSTSIRSNFARRWNFGTEGEMTVLDVLKVAKEVWPKIEYVVKEEETHPSMVQLLKIDSTEAKRKLGWKPRWGMEEAIRRTVEWYRAYYSTGGILSHKDISDYEGEL